MEDDTNMGSGMIAVIAKLAQVNYNGSLNCNIMYIKWKYNVNMLKQNMYEYNHVIRRCAKPPPNYVPQVNLLKNYLGQGNQDYNLYDAFKVIRIIIMTLSG